MKSYRLIKAIYERAIWCCYSSHSSVDKIIALLSSLRFEIIKPFVCPDNVFFIDSMKTSILNTPRSQNPAASNESGSKKFWNEKTKLIKRRK